MFKLHLSCINSMPHICSQPIKFALPFCTSSQLQHQCQEKKQQCWEFSFFSIIILVVGGQKESQERNLPLIDLVWQSIICFVMNVNSFSPSLLLSVFFPTIFQIIPFFFSVSLLGSDLSVCRKYVIHMHLKISHCEYGIANQLWLYAHGYTLIMIVIDSM